MFYNASILIKLIVSRSVNVRHLRGINGNHWEEQSDGVSLGTLKVFPEINEKGEPYEMERVGPRDA